MYDAMPSICIITPRLVAHSIFSLRNLKHVNLSLQQVECAFEVLLSVGREEEDACMGTKMRPLFGFCG